MNRDQIAKREFPADNDYFNIERSAFRTGWDKALQNIDWDGIGTEWNLLNQYTGIRASRVFEFIKSKLNNN